MTDFADRLLTDSRPTMGESFLYADRAGLRNKKAITDFGLFCHFRGDFLRLVIFVKPGMLLNRSKMPLESRLEVQTCCYSSEKLKRELEAF